jgi:hypothetical protein
MTAVQAFESTLVSNQFDFAEVGALIGTDLAQEGDEIFWADIVDFAQLDNAGFFVLDELENGYQILKPIVVEIRRTDDNTYTASFDDANIATTGENVHDAYQALVAEILDTYDALLGEPVLGINAAGQLEVLRSYIGKA